MSAYSQVVQQQDLLKDRHRPQRILSSTRQLCHLPSLQAPAYVHVHSVCPIHRLASGGGLLMDAGENTWAQLVRCYNNLHFPKYLNLHYNSSLCRLASGGGLLMDAGEGTWAQLVRCYGPAGAAAQVASLAAVWVSHRHADHMLGLPALLAARPPSAPPLLIIGGPRCLSCAAIFTAHTL